MNKKILALFSAALLSANVYASGYQVALQGQKQIAMGHAGTGLAMDASSLFFNPGAMSYLRQNGVTIGGSGIFSSVAYRAANSNVVERTNSPVGTPFHAYGVWGPKDSMFKFGLGVYTPYGSGVKWEDGWSGRFLLNELTLRAITFQPTASIKLGEMIGIGVGFTYTTGSVNLKRNLDLTSADGEATAELDGKANGIGFNAGIYVTPSESFSVGLTYRSKTTMKVEGGDATFKVPASLSANFPEGNKFDASLPLASVTSLGIGYKPTENLTLAFDVNYTGWSAFDSLNFTYEKPVAGNNRTLSPRKYKDAFAFRLGAQYAVNESLFLRAGGYYDMTPVQAGYMTPETPDANRIGLSGGVGYKIGDNFVIDASILFINGQKREQTQADIDAAGTNTVVQTGTYKLAAVVPGLSLSYNF